METIRKTDIETLAELYNRVVSLRKDLSCFVNYAFEVPEETLHALSDTEAKLAKAILTAAKPEEIQAFVDACANRKHQDSEKRAQQWEMPAPELLDIGNDKPSVKRRSKAKAVAESVPAPAAAEEAPKKTRKRAKK